MDFRLACALLKEVDFYVGPEGGFGHVAAALNKKAVLYFGGWISPDVIGYEFHENIYYEDKQSPCGVKLKLCNIVLKQEKDNSRSFFEIFIKLVLLN